MPFATSEIRAANSIAGGTASLSQASNCHVDLQARFAGRQVDGCVRLQPLRGQDAQPDRLTRLPLAGRPRSQGSA